MSKDTCSVCGRSKASIGAEVRAMQDQGVMVINHDLIAYCPTCDKTFCSKHYSLNDMAGTHTCYHCNGDLQVERTGYLT